MSSPFVKIEWNKYEVALLIESYKNVALGKISRQDAVSLLSQRLRKGMMLHGVIISDKYRNENGISLQMSAIEYCLSNGTKGMDSGSKLFGEIAQMAMEDHESFSLLLSDATSIYPELSNETSTAKFSSTKRESKIVDDHTLAIVKSVLSKYFKKGINTQSTLDRKRFRLFYFNVAGTEYNKTDDKLISMIKSCGIECNQKIFVPESMLHFEVRKAIYDYISATFSSGKEFIFYDLLYKQFYNELLDSAIVNQNMLHLYLQFYYCDKWIFKKKYITLHKNVSVSIDDEVIDFVREYGKPIMRNELLEALSWLPKDDVSSVFNNNPTILVSSGKLTKFHISLLG